MKEADHEHLYKIDGKYYLLAYETDTEYFFIEFIYSEKKDRYIPNLENLKNNEFKEIPIDEFDLDHTYINVNYWDVKL